MHLLRHAALARSVAAASLIVECGAGAACLQISPEQGALMGWLVAALGVKRIIEVWDASRTPPHPLLGPRADSRCG